MRDANEESCEHKESSKIDGYNGFKEKVFEEVGRINNGQYQNSWKKDCQSRIIDASLEYHFHIEPI